MSRLDRLLDLDCIEVSLVKARLRVLGPEEALDLHCRSHAVGRARKPLWQATAQQKTPRRGAGAFLGLLQGGEICISIYVDPWEVGGPLRAAGAPSMGVDERHMGGARPSQEDRVQPFIVLSCESLKNDTNICAIRV